MKRIHRTQDALTEISGRVRRLVAGPVGTALAATLAATWALALTWPSSPAIAQGGPPPQDEPQEITLTLDDFGLHAEGITPGGEVAWFGAWRTRHVYWTEIGRLDERATDDDSDGAVRWDWDPEASVPYAGVFLVIDLKTGDYASVAPGAFRGREIPLGAVALAEDGGQFSVRSDSLLFLTVRPGVDAWSVRVRDGDGHDSRRGTDGYVRLPPGKLKSKGRGTPPPAAWKHKDRLFAVDTSRLEYFALIVPRRGR